MSIISYWSEPAERGKKHKPIRAIEASSEWSARSNRYRIFTDRDVLPLMASFDRDLPLLFKRIRIPACKSDLARLVLLQAYGGLYVDAHVSPGDDRALRKVIEDLDCSEMIVFDNEFEHRYEGDFHLMNSVMGAKRGSNLILQLIRSATANLRSHFALERSSAVHIPYNIFILTGAWDIFLNLFNTAERPFKLLPQFVDRVQIRRHGKQQDIFPFHLHKNYSLYSESGLHWSERQVHERLFNLDETP